MMYYDYASLGIPNEDAIEEVSTLMNKLPVNILNRGGDHTLEMVAMLEKTRERIAKLYDVSTENIAFISNTTEGLGIIASALKASDLCVNVLVPDIEFMSSALVWHGNADQLTLCNTIDGILPADKINKCLNEHGNIFCVSAVQEVSGYRFPFQHLLKLREKQSNEFWIVDGIQEAGIFRRDLVADQIDAYIVGGHKWLNSPFGLGFMYISDRLLEKIQPAYYGYFNLEEPAEGWIDYLESRKRRLADLYKIPKQKGARIFETGGMVNVFGAFMLGKSIDLWKQFGIDKAKDHVLKLQHRFREKIKVHDTFKILGGETEESWSSIVTLSGKNDVKKERMLFQKLIENGVKVSLRSIEGIGGIRIGFHYTTERRDVERLANLINSILNAR